MWGYGRASEPGRRGPGQVLRRLAVALALPLALPLPAAAAPARVVSMNLCTDELAMLLAAPGQLVSVSFLAADPMVSAMAAEAAAYPQNHGQAEEIFLLHPDVVLAGPYSARATVALLRRLGVEVVTVPAPQSLAEVPQTIRAAGRAIGREPEAGAMAARFAADLAALEATAPQAGRAALYGPSGFTSGPGTLANDMLKAGGWGNVAAEAGISGYGRLALERLVMAWPDLMVTSTPYPGASRPEAILHHPALRALEAATRPPLGTDAGWNCGTPKLLGAVAALAAAHGGTGE